MFDVSWSELLVVGVVALIVVGPKELPALLRTVGRYIGMVKRQAAEFRTQFDDAMRDSEIESLKKDVEGIGRDVESSIRDAEHSVQNEFDGARHVLDGAAKAEDVAAPVPDAAIAAETDGSPVEPVTETAEAVPPAADPTSGKIVGPLSGLPPEMAAAKALASATEGGAKRNGMAAPEPAPPQTGAPAA